MMMMMMSFGQCPKENILFLMRCSLIMMMMMIFVVGHKGVVYLGLGTAGAVT